MSERMSDSVGNVPAGTRWCPHCDGYGLSLKEAGQRCSRCGGTGLVAIADPGDQRPNGQEPGRLGHAE